MKNIKELFETIYNNIDDDTKYEMISGFSWKQNFEEDVLDFKGLKWKFENSEVSFSGGMASKQIVISTDFLGKKEYLRLDVLLDSEGSLSSYFEYDTGYLNLQEVFPKEVTVVKFLTDSELKISEQQEQSIKM